MSRTFTISLAILAGLLCASGATGQSLSSVSGAFADVGVSPRAAAMGMTGVAGGVGVQSVRWNPAAATNLTKLEAEFSFVDQFGIARYGQVGVGVSMGRAWGAALTIRDSGDDVYRETSVGVTVARRLRGFSLGVTAAALVVQFGNNDLSGGDFSVFDPDEIASGIANQIQGDAMGVALDAGVRYAMGGASLGLTVRNAFAPLSWSSASAGGGYSASYSESLPLEIVVGAEVPAGRGARIALDYRPAYDRELDDIIRTGAEWTWANLLAIRAGMERSLNGRADERYGVGFGLGPVGAKGIELKTGYGYMTGLLGATQQVSISIRVP